MSRSDPINSSFSGIHVRDVFAAARLRRAIRRLREKWRNLFLFLRKEPAITRSGARTDALNSQGPRGRMRAFPLMPLRAGIDIPRRPRLSRNSSREVPEARPRLPGHLARNATQRRRPSGDVRRPLVRSLGLFFFLLSYTYTLRRFIDFPRALFRILLHFIHIGVPRWTRLPAVAFFFFFFCCLETSLSRH